MLSCSLQSALVRILRRRGLEAHSMNLWAVNPTPSQRKTMSGWIYWSKGHLLNSALLAFDNQGSGSVKRCEFYRHTAKFGMSCFVFYSVVGLL